MLELARETAPGAEGFAVLALPRDPCHPADAIVGVGHPINYLPSLDAIHRGAGRHGRRAAPRRDPRVRRLRPRVRRGAPSTTRRAAVGRATTGRWSPSSRCRRADRFVRQMAIFSRNPTARGGGTMSAMTTCWWTSTRSRRCSRSTGSTPSVRTPSATRRCRGPAHGRGPQGRLKPGPAPSGAGSVCALRRRPRCPRARRPVMVGRHPARAYPIVRIRRGFATVIRSISASDTPRLPQTRQERRCRYV